MDTTIPPAAAPPPDSLPRQFGRYRLVRLLGAGGMGTVYLAFDSVLERDVALKMPHPSLIAGPVERERFYREGRAAARLRHPNLCPVLDLGEIDSAHYITMPHIEGMTLADNRIADPFQAARLVRTLARAMAFAHRLHVVHRDLKPENVLITPDGEPVITDFGLALRLDADRRVTEPGAIMGTLPFTSPEQARGEIEATGPAGDVYSLGVILYWLLTGRPPFAHYDRLVLLMLIEEGVPQKPSQLRPGLDRQLEAICLRALAKQAGDRQPSMDVLANDLDSWLGSIPCAASPVPRIRRAAVRFVFVGVGERASGMRPGQDRLFLDVGNDLRPGVLDHHQLVVGACSTTRLVLDYGSFLEASVNPQRKPEDPFTIVLHEEPDLDAAAAAHLALCYLESGEFPAGAFELARYVDEVDSGARGLTHANPFDLYAGYVQLTNRLLRQSWNSLPEQWQKRVWEGLELVGFVLVEGARLQRSVTDVDAFRSPHLTDDDRADLANDQERYRRMLVDPRTCFRVVRLCLPGQFGEAIDVDGLLARDVQNMDDPQRCRFFKDWARTDKANSPGGHGFAAMSVFCSEGPGRPRRCILSAEPASRATLRGLGEALESAESNRRKNVFGVDDRLVDSTTGEHRIPRPGYDNADPWYDGRAHGYTIVDAPRAGTMLTAEEIDEVFLRFGGVLHER